MRTASEDTAHVIENADWFVAVAFRGRARYKRIECKTLAEARIAAEWLYTNRPVGIYAIASSLTREVHVENWEPRKEVKTND